MLAATSEQSTCRDRSLELLRAAVVSGEGSACGRVHGLAGRGRGGDHRGMAAEEWTTAEHALSYLGRADALPHRKEGEGVLLGEVSKGASRVLDLGTGDGRLLALLRPDRPQMLGVGLDLSEPMLEEARKRFVGDERVELLEHDLATPVPDLGRFDAVVSSFAIHHLEHDRKRSLYGEVFERLEPGGVFCNLEHVASPTERLHRRFYAALGCELGWEDASNRLLDVETQLRWLRELGFEDVDCYWKWLEMALLIGVKPEKRG
jgi:tRNA (cmo5U34)-methyltransferase